MKVEEFLDYFKRIEKSINKLGGFNENEPFSIQLDKISEKKPYLKNIKDELRQFSNLRNIYSHNPKSNGNYIAEPTEYTLKRIKEIVNKLENPILVKDKFIFEVIGANEEDYINEILKTMYSMSFSQFPIFQDGKVIELINTNTISRWLSANLEENGNIIHTDIKVKNLKPFIEFNENYSFVSKKTNVDDAFEKFKNQIRNSKRNLDVLFVTENGKMNEKIEGLITIEDIAEYI